MNRERIIALAHQAEKEPIYPDPRFPPSLYYRFFRLLAAEMRPTISVELGVLGGGGSLHLALGWPQGTVIGVDIKNIHYPENVAYVMAHCPNFEFWECDSVQAGIAYKAAGSRPVNILFLDTLHTYAQVMAEFEAWEPCLAGGAVVCLDDLYRGGMDDVWAQLPGQKVPLDFLHDSYGFGAILL